MKRATRVLMIWLAIGFVAVRCAKKNDSVAESGSSVSTVQCMSGQLASSDGRSCLYPSSFCQSGYGFNPYTNQCVPGTAIGGLSGIAFGNSLSITNQSQFRKLLEDYTQGCTGTTFYYQILGTNPYTYYTSSGFADIRMNTLDSTSAQITIGAGTTSPDNGYYAAYVPLYFTANLYNTNSNTGVSWIVSSGIGACPTIGNASQLQIYSNTQGLRTNNQQSAFIDVFLVYRGVTFAQARLQAY
jgi:hypothetical protein